MWWNVHCRVSPKTDIIIKKLISLVINWQIYLKRSCENFMPIGTAVSEKLKLIQTQQHFEKNVYLHLLYMKKGSRIFKIRRWISPTLKKRPYNLKLLYQCWKISLPRQEFLQTNILISSIVIKSLTLSPPIQKPTLVCLQNPLTSFLPNFKVHVGIYNQFNR